MINLIRSEFYKLFKGNVFKVFIIIYICTSFFICGIMKFMGFFLNNPNSFAFLSDSSSTQMIVELGEGDVNDMMAQAEEEMKAQAEVINNMTSSSMLQMLLQGNTIPCILLVFTSIFVVSEFSEGTVKNIASRGKPRYQIYISKLISGGVGMMLATATLIISTILFSAIFFKFDLFTGDNLKGVAILLLTQMLLSFALNALFMLVGMIFRNVGAAIAVSFGVVTVSVMIFNVLNIILAPFKATNLSLIFSMGSLGKISITNGEILQILILFVSYTVITSLIGIFVMNKKDIK